MSTPVPSELKPPELLLDRRRAGCLATTARMSSRASSIPTVCRITSIGCTARRRRCVDPDTTRRTSCRRRQGSASPGWRPRQPRRHTRLGSWCCRRWWVPDLVVALLEEENSSRRVAGPANALTQARWWLVAPPTATHQSAVMFGCSPVGRLEVVTGMCDCHSWAEGCAGVGRAWRQRGWRCRSCRTGSGRGDRRSWARS